MNPETTAMTTQPCPRCRVLLDTTGSGPGAWLTCPGCGQPVRVPPRPIVRPARPGDAGEDLPTVAWAKDPRLDGPGPWATSDVEDGPPGPWRTERRAGFLHILLLSGLAGVAHAMFAGSYLMATNPRELLMCWGFGAMVALFVAIMINTMRWGGTRERRGPL